MENSVNNNGSPECYKGGRRGERSSPISEIYEGVRRNGQDALSDESWEWRKLLVGARIYRPRGRNEWRIWMARKFILRMNLGWIHQHTFFLLVHIRSAVHPAWPNMGSEQVPFCSTDFVLYHTGCIPLGSRDQSHHQTSRVLFYRFCFVPHWMHPAWLTGSESSSSDQSCSFLPILFCTTLDASRLAHGIRVIIRPVVFFSTDFEM